MCVFPRAGNPTRHTAIFPAWYSCPDSVEYSLPPDIYAMDTCYLYLYLW